MPSPPSLEAIPNRRNLYILPNQEGDKIDSVSEKEGDMKDDREVGIKLSPEREKVEGPNNQMSLPHLPVNTNPEIRSSAAAVPSLTVNKML